jgi:hypothetical protein
MKEVLSFLAITWVIPVVSFAWSPTGVSFSTVSNSKVSASLLETHTTNTETSTYNIGSTGFNMYPQFGINGDGVDTESFTLLDKTDNPRATPPAPVYHLWVNRAAVPVGAVPATIVWRSSGKSRETYLYSSSGKIDVNKIFTDTLGGYAYVSYDDACYAQGLSIPKWEDVKNIHNPKDIGLTGYDDNSMYYGMITLTPETSVLMAKDEYKAYLVKEAGEDWWDEEIIGVREGCIRTVSAEDYDPNTPGPSLQEQISTYITDRKEKTEKDAKEVTRLIDVYKESETVWKQQQWEAAKAKEIRNVNDLNEREDAYSAARYSSGPVAVLTTPRNRIAGSDCGHKSYSVDKEYLGEYKEEYGERYHYSGESFPYDDWKKIKCFI